MPRPPAGTTTASPFARSTARVPSAPPPCPTTLIAMVAIPRDASTDATAQGAPYMLSVKPCPKIATGQPPAGFGPAGRNTAKCILVLDWGTGRPVRVGGAG